MAISKVAPLADNVQIVKPDGTPTAYFVRQLANLLAEKAVTDAAAADAVPQGRLINTAAPINGGGDLTADLTLGHDTSGVTAGTYGDGTHVPQFHVDADGHITSASNVAITGGGGGAWSLLAHSVIASGTTNLDYNVSAYSDVMVVGEGITLASTGYRGVTLSVDGGTTFYHTTGDYSTLNAAGTETTTYLAFNHGTQTTAARAFAGRICAINTTGRKVSEDFAESLTRYFTASAAPITHIRVCGIAASAGALINMNAGDVYIYVR